MEETTDVIIGMDAVKAIREQIAKRQSERQKLHEQIIDLNGQIAGLQEAQYQVERQDGYNVALPKS